LYCISISYKSADVHIRERLAFTPEVQHQLMTALRETKRIDQCAVLCTCSRTELYFCGGSNACATVKSALAVYSGMTEESLTPYIRTYQEDSALLHLFRVASGMDSMVLGEDEILGQTKAAYRAAQDCGAVGYELNMIFQAAIACAKKIKTQTGISSTPVSIATLAANAAAGMGGAVNALVIGATGKIGMATLKNLLPHKNVQVTATIRQHNNALKIAADAPVKTVDYEERYRCMDDADCIISATSSPHYTVTCSGLRSTLKTEKKRLFIDLAVPPDMDSGIAELPGAVCMGIDYFQQLSRENNARKLDYLETAEAILVQEADALQRELVFHEFLPHAKAVRTAMTENSPESLLYHLKSELNAPQLAAVLRALKDFAGGV
jgi:glutamyl-tRNA reductase